MIYSRNEIEEYPFSGEFHEYGIDTSLPPLEQVEGDILVLSTKCDIQETNTTDSSGATISNYSVFFKFDKSVPFPIKNGCKFIGSMYGIDVIGEVIGISATQMGGAEITLKKTSI